HGGTITSVKMIRTGIPRFKTLHCFVIIFIFGILAYISTRLVEPSRPISDTSEYAVRSFEGLDRVMEENNVLSDVLPDVGKFKDQEKYPNKQETSPMFISTVEYEDEDDSDEDESENDNDDDIAYPNPPGGYSSPDVTNTPGERRRYFLILSMPRSGTSVFKELLNNHPNIICHDAILHENKKPYELRLSSNNQIPPEKHILLNYIKDMLEEDIEDDPNVTPGFKITNVQLAANNITLMDIVKHLGYPNIIVMYRRELLQQFMSLQTAIARGQYNSRIKPNEITKVPLRWEDFLDYRTKLLDGYRSSMKELQNYPRKIILTYEDFDNGVSGMNNVVRQAIEFIGLPTPIKNYLPKLVKQSPRGLGSKISNFKQVEQTIQDNESLLTFDINDI
ncbi:unnamed protein product, partial [Owenia fusiformis]